MPIPHPNQPNKPRPKHRRRRVQHHRPKRIHTPKSLLKTRPQLRPRVQRYRLRTQRLKEKMIVKRHAGVIEERSVHGVAGEADDDFLGFFVFVFLPGGEGVEFLDYHGLVGRPGYLEAGAGEEVRDAGFFEGGVVGAEFDYAVEGTALLMLLGADGEVLGEEGGAGLGGDQYWVVALWYGIAYA